MPLDNKDYQSYLEDTVFKTNELGQFTILFDLFRYLNNSEQNLAILERSYIFGGLSIFAGLAPDASPQIIDFRPRSSKERTGFQQGWLDIEKFNFPRSTGEIVEHADEIIIQKDWMSSEALVLPNVIHHSFDLRRLIRTILLHSQTVKRVYFFDSYLREEHQVPDDHCRYTPSALDCVMSELSFQRFWQKEYGNVFDGMLYLFHQAQKILEENQELCSVKNSIISLSDQLQSIKNNRKYVSLGRPHARMVSSYALGYEFTH